MRARNIKPGFFKNDLLVELPFEYRLLFVGVWTMADRDGRLEDRPTKIRMEIFPADSVDVDMGLQALHDSGFIQRYEADGKRFIQVLAWERHQNPHMKEAASTIPAPCEHSASTMKAPAKADTSPADSLIPDSLIPDSKEEPKATVPAAPAQHDDGSFLLAWSAYPKRGGGNSRADTLKSWKARLKEGEEPANLIAGAERYRAFIEATGKVGTEFVMQGCRFFGAGKHYEEDWRPPRAVAPQQAPPGKTMQTLKLIEDMKNGLAHPRNSDRFSEADLPQLGAPTSR